LKIKNYAGINAAFRSYAGIPLVIGLLCICCLQDTHRKKNQTKPKFRTAVTQLGASLKIDASFIVAMGSIFCCIMSTITAYQFGLVYYMEMYASDEVTQAYISERLSNMILGVQLVSLPLYIATGFVLDHMKVWKSILASSLTMMLALAGFWYYSNSSQKLTAHEQSGSIWMMDTCFCAILTIYGLQFQMSFTLFSKAIKLAPQAKGVASGISACMTSLGVVMTDSLGAWLFDQQDRAVFVMCFFAFATLAVATIGLRLAKLLDI
jgi:hypothetical protein